VRRKEAASGLRHSMTFWASQLRQQRKKKRG